MIVATEHDRITKSSQPAGKSAEARLQRHPHNIPYLANGRTLTFLGFRFGPLYKSLNFFGPGYGGREIPIGDWGLGSRVIPILSLQHPCNVPKVS